MLAQILLVLAVTTSPTSRPTTQQSTEAYLRGLIRNLQEQVTSLRAENIELKKQVADLSAQVQKPKPGEAIVDTDKMERVTDRVTVGMTREELMDLMRRRPDRESSDAHGNETLQWTFLSYEGMQPSGGHANGYPSASFTVSLTDGKVISFRKSKGLRN